MRHSHGDVLVLQKGGERLVQSGANHTHGVGEAGKRDVSRNVPCLRQRIGKRPEVAQQPFLTSTQHGDNETSSHASFIKHPQRCMRVLVGLPF